MGLLTSDTVNFVLLAELADAFTSGLLLTIASLYCTHLVDNKSLVTFRGLMGGLHGGLGKIFFIFV